MSRFTCQISKFSALSVFVTTLSCAPLQPQRHSQLLNEPVTIQIDNSAQHKTIEGFGATTFVSVIFTGDGVQDMLSSSMRQRAIDTVYGRVGLTMGNMELQHEPANDDDDPFQYNWEGFNWSSHDVMHNLLIHPAPAGRYRKNSGYVMN